MIARAEPPHRAPTRRALIASPGARLREAALIPYSPLYCAVFNYARLDSAMRALGLQAARDTVAAHFAPRHMDQIRSLLVDARRFMLRWGTEALAQWSTEVDANGYAGEAEQMAVRVATEAAGGEEAHEFWLGFSSK